MLDRPIDFNLWRAPTDNDAPIADKWKLERLDHTVTRAYEVEISETEHSGTPDDGAVSLRVRQSVGAMSNQPILRIVNKVTVYPDGRILLDINAVKDPEILTLPRIGLRLFLSSGMKNVSYFGMGPGETVTEAKAMHDWLIAHGIPEERILQEPRATSTQENLAFSFQIIRERGDEPDGHVAIVSSAYHLYRAKEMAKLQGVEAAGVAAPWGYFFVMLNYFIREAFGVTHLWVFGN